MDALGGAKFFNFMQFLGKFGKIVCRHPPTPQLGEILDPPLLTTLWEIMDLPLTAFQSENSGLSKTQKIFRI